MKPDEQRWQRFVGRFATVFLGGLATLYGFVLLIDPFDTGRTPLALDFGVADEDPRTAAASRGRDPAFNAAVIGNSRGQMIHPERLSRATGLRFTQLTVPGSGPMEQSTIANWFIRQHGGARAFVLVADESWCAAGPRLEHPFPFWIYEPSSLTYFANILNTRAVERGFRRVAIVLGLREASARNGFWDYEMGRQWAFKGTEPAPAVDTISLGPPFPAIEALPWPGAERLVIVIPPVFYTALPNDTKVEACKRALAQVPGAILLDFLRDGPIARDPSNFMDHTHYRSRVALELERAIAAALANGAPTPDAAH
jgi:hypothetical protein